MSCTQLTACQLTVNPKHKYPARCVSRAHVNFSGTPINLSKHSLAVSRCVSLSHVARTHFSISKQSFAAVPWAAKLQQHGPVCVFGDKGKSETTDEGSPQKALEKLMGNFKKEPSVEELLKQQIVKREYYGDGGITGGGGGGGGGGGSGSGESEDEGFSGIIEEVSQVLLATLGFIFLYIYIIDGEDIMRLGKDFIKFIFSGKKSIRLGRVLYGWSRFLQRFKTKKPEMEEYWLESAIINTPTWYDGPNKYKRVLNSLAESSNVIDDDLGSRSYDNDDDDDDGDDSGSKSDDNDDDPGSRSNDNDEDDL